MTLSGGCCTVFASPTSQGRMPELPQQGTDRPPHLANDSCDETLASVRDLRPPDDDGGDGDGGSKRWAREAHIHTQC